MIDEDHPPPVFDHALDQAMWPWPSLELSSLNPSTSPFAVLRHQQHPRISPLVPLPLPPGSTATSLIAKQPGTLCGQAYVQGQRRATSLSQAAPSLQPITTTKHQASGLYNTVSHDVGLNGLARSVQQGHDAQAPDTPSQSRCLAPFPLSRASPCTAMFNWAARFDSLQAPPSRAITTAIYDQH